MRPSTAMIVVVAAVLPLLPPARVAYAEDAAKQEAPKREAEPAEEALNKPLPDLLFDGVPLEDGVDFLRDASGATIWLDRASLKKAGIDRSTLAIKLKINKGQTLKDALAVVTGQMTRGKDGKAVAEPCGAVIVISTEKGAKAFVERHRNALKRVSKDAPKLDRKLPEVTFDKVPLGDVIDFLRDVTSANIEVDWKALAAAGVQKNKSLTVRARNLKFSQALRLILDDVAADKPLDFVADGNRVIITEASAVKDVEKKLKEEGL